MCLLVSLCIIARLSASCCIVTCFFVDVVDFSLMTTLFCFISLGRSDEKKSPRPAHFHGILPPLGDATFCSPILENLICMM